VGSALKSFPFPGTTKAPWLCRAATATSKVFCLDSALPCGKLGFVPQPWVSTLFTTLLSVVFWGDLSDLLPISSYPKSPDHFVRVFD
jgi:hypothetical protein